MDERPTSRREYSDEIIEELCDRLAEGESLTAVCRDPRMPNRKTIFRWAEADAGFRARYQFARTLQADKMSAEILQIADDASEDFEPVDGKPRVNWEAINRSRLKVDTRKWLMSKMHPELYADAMKIEHGGTLAATTPFAELDIPSRLEALRRFAFGITHRMILAGVDEPEASSFGRTWFVEMARRVAGKEEPQPTALLPALPAEPVYSEVVTHAPAAHPGFAPEESGTTYTTQAEEERLAMRRIENEVRRRQMPTRAVTRRPQQW